jgi:hypothetical protein
MGDAIKGTMLILAMILAFAIFAAWVVIWNDTWRAATGLTYSRIIERHMDRSPCLLHSWSWWWTANCKVT